MSQSCPSEFVVSPNGQTCILPCPTAKNYALTINGNSFVCTYAGDSKITVPLMPVPMYFAGGTIQPGASSPVPANAPYTSLPNKEVYKAEIERFAQAIAVADANINNETKILTAFTALQQAENARDTAPDAYQAARTAYYILTKGRNWIEQEKARIANVEAQPIVNGYVARYNDIQAKKNQQQSTIEVVNGIRDKVLTVKDDLVFSVSTFQKQIGDIKNQINKNKVEQAQSIAAASSWVDTFLNWVIALVTLIAIVILGRRFMTKSGPPPTIEEVEAKARFIRAQAMLRNANTRGPRGWFS
jgi:hypothetical protein